MCVRSERSGVVAPPRCCCGLGPQRGTKPPKAALVPNEEPSCGTTARARLPSLSLSLSRSPFGFGSVADRAPSQRPLSLMARAGARAPVPRLAGAVFITLITAHAACALCVLLAGASANSAAGRCGPGCGLLRLTLPAPVWSVSSMRPRGLVGERQL